MSARFALAAVAMFALGPFACGTKTVPPGTPPPEYERRELPPWPPDAAAAPPDIAPSIEPPADGVHSPNDAAPAPAPEDLPDQGAPADAGAPDASISGIIRRWRTPPSV